VGFAVDIKIGQEEFDEFLVKHEDSGEGVVGGLMVNFELSTLKNDGEFELVSKVPLENFDTRLEGDLERLIPGRRSVRTSVVSDSGVLFGSRVVDFIVKDSGSSIGADVDITDYTPSSATGGQGHSYDAYFSQVYRYKVWSAQGDMGSDSGPGSNLDKTNNMRQLIAELVLNGGVKRIVDVPCGDMNWMGTLLPLLKEAGVKYLGMDVVGDVVQRNQEKYGGEEGVEFRQLDLTKDQLPSMDEGDLILCRHLMFHLPPAENLKIIEKFERSGAGVLMMTTYLRADENYRDFVLAMGHHVNLFRAPYCATDPFKLVSDDDLDLYLAMWRIGGGQGKRVLGTENRSVDGGLEGYDNIEIHGVEGEVCLR